MSGKSPIQWTETTWNPVVGCKRVSVGCDHCYAFALHDKRHIAWKRGTFPTAPAQYHKPFSQVQLMPERLDDPLHWRKPRMVFVNSMSDLFHDDVPGSFINDVWMTMRKAKQHTYQILTKRPQRLLEWTRTKANATGWPINEIWPSWVWLGVSVENQQTANERIPLLLQTPTSGVRFLSMEPLLGPVSRLKRLPGYLYTADIRPADDALGRGINWVIIGGESGVHARPMDLAWVESLLQQCEAAGVAVFVKQLGSVWAKYHHAKDHHGGNPDEWPEHLRVREFPTCAQSVEVAG